jgi:AcrR family transcriptional regulator
MAARPVLAGGVAAARAEGDGARARVAEMQRARLLAAAVQVFDERGLADTAVAHITARARVSRRTFYELFANRDECLAAMLDDIAARVGAELTAAGLEELQWRERVRAGLWAILSFLDREPVLARVGVVQALRGGPVVLESRERILMGLAGVVDGGRREGTAGARCTPLTAEGLVGAAFAIVHARLLRGERRPLTGLYGELLGLIVLPYLGPAAAGREQARPASVPAARARRRPAAPAPAPSDPLEGVVMRLTYRTARVLEAVAELGGRGADPSNRRIAEHAGIHDPGQISKLLRRLQGLGLVVNAGGGAHTKGEPNAWRLTARGERVAQGIRLHGLARGEAA